MKIKLHSTTDLITNSSTTIFTYSENSIKACKNMIDEILKTFNIDKKCDDLFNLVVLSDKYTYLSFLGRGEYDDEEEEKELPKGITEEDIKNFDKFYEDVSCGKVSKPKWFKDAESNEDYDGYSPDTTLNITAKEPQYEKIADLVEKFLYSTNHEATRDG